MYHTATLHAVLRSDWTLWLGDGQGGGTSFGTKLKITSLNLAHPCRCSLFRPSPGPSCWAVKDKFSVAMETRSRNQCRAFSALLNANLFMSFACWCIFRRNGATCTAEGKAVVRPTRPTSSSLGICYERMLQQKKCIGRSVLAATDVSYRDEHGFEGIGFKRKREALLTLLKVFW